MKSKRDRNTEKLIDIDAVTRDDALLDVLGRGDEPVAASDDPVVRMLYLWRRDLAADESSSAPRWAAMSRRLVTAAAAIVIGVGSLGGVAAAAGTAEPGSPLWGLSEVVYAERADSLTAKENALDALSQARGLMATDPALARELLAEAARQAAHVRGEDGAEAVRRQIEDLRRALDGDSGSPNSSSSGAGPGLARPGVSPRPDGAQPVAPPPTSSPPTSSPTSPPTQPASPPPSSPPASPTPSPSDPSPSASSSASSGPTSETSPSP